MIFDGRGDPLGEAGLFLAHDRGVHDGLLQFGVGEDFDCAEFVFDLHDEGEGQRRGIAFDCNSAASHAIHHNTARHRKQGEERRCDQGEGADAWDEGVGLGLHGWILVVLEGVGSGCLVWEECGT